MKLTEKLRQTWLSRGDTAVSPTVATSANTPDPVQPRVLIIIHNPVIPFEGQRKLHEVLRWHDPDELTQQYIADLEAASYGYVRYQVVERIEVDDFPVKADGFRYDADSFLFRWRSRTGFHHPDLLDYPRLLQKSGIVSRVNAGQIDEVWLFGFPYAGYHESLMVGRDAFVCNAPPLLDADSQRRFVVMGFNYERGIGEMLERFGHRAESIMAQVYRQKRGEANLWARFSRYDKSHPGLAECGTVHFAPNSERDYDWGNGRFVPSRCDDWFNFPNFQATSRHVNGDEWGNGDMRYHHLWWLGHMPHTTGKTNSILNNWWAYIINPNLVK
ncbi:MAG: hypothetical protein IPF56_08280 [Chloroflexi bacterium]|nr:hypothetical protein [Chloroflexota bacterium]MBK6709224.1 hypothetical protein [Chloroflexota bacterium]